MTSGFPRMLSTSVPIGRPQKESNVMLNFPSEKSCCDVASPRHSLTTCLNFVRFGLLVARSTDKGGCPVGPTESGAGSGRGVAGNLAFFGGINFYCTILQSYKLTSSAATSAQGNFQGLIMGVSLLLISQVSSGMCP